MANCEIAVRLTYDPERTNPADLAYVISQILSQEIDSGRVSDNGEDGRGELTLVSVEPQ